MDAGIDDRLGDEIAVTSQVADELRGLLLREVDALLRRVQHRGQRERRGDLPPAFVSVLFGQRSHPRSTLPGVSSSGNRRGPRPTAPVPRAAAPSTTPKLPVVSPVLRLRLRSPPVARRRRVPATRPPPSQAHAGRRSGSP